MPFLGLMRVSECDARMAGRQVVINRLDASVNSKDETIGRLVLERDQALADAQKERDTASRILRDKIAVESEAKRLRGQLVAMERTIASLEPDARKHREKLRRDRENIAKRRARTAGHMDPADRELHQI